MLNKASSTVFGHVRTKNEFRSVISDRSCERILLKCNTKQPKTINYNISKSEENQEPKYRRESAPMVLHKMAAMTSQNWNFQKSERKRALANILKCICVDFHQNWQSPFGCRADTHTHIHTDIQKPSAWF